MEKKPEKKSFTKFISNLLFEETESIDLNGIEEAASAPVQETPAPVIPVQQAPVVQQPIETKPEIETVQIVPAAEPVQTVQPVQEVQEAPRTTMQRIDLTQNIDLREIRTEQPRRPQPQQSESVFRVAGDKPKARPQAPGNTAEAAQKKTQPSSRPSKTAEDRKAGRQAYVFQPPISPMFGVDEKDLNALKTTTSKLNQAEKEKARRSEYVTQIISPIYGRNQDDSPVMIQKTVEKSNIMEQMTVTAEKTQAEEEIPDFSLDDILATSDEQFRHSAEETMEDTAPLFGKTDDEDEGDEDGTVLITRAEYERLRRGGNG